jgi:L,D-peptidoglycan transpeptidase YkuD (ErfK/YbiS/YcfS/YnhG family)
MIASARRRHSIAGAFVAVAALATACGASEPTDAVSSSAGAVSTLTTVAPAPPTVSAASSLSAPLRTDETIVSGSAVASLPAVRVDPPYSECQRIARSVAATRPATKTQVIIRTAAWADTTASVELATWVGSTWTCSAPMVGRVGRSGLRPLADRRSGDGTTPAGVFALATMTAPDGQRFSFFGNAPDPGVTAGTYRQVQPGDCFGATPGTSGYGHLRHDTTCPGPDDEYLPQFTTTYSNAALIGANMEPDVSGDAPGEPPYASAIFLHRFTYVSGQSGATKPTSGCVSVAQTDLTAVLVGLTAQTQFVIGTTDWLLDGTV